MTVATELSKTRLKVAHQGDSISIEVPLSVFKVLTLPLTLGLSSAALYAVGIPVSILAFLMPLFMCWPEFVHERIELRPDGLRFRLRNRPVQKYETLRWKPINRIRADSGGWLGSPVRLEFNGAPYLGTPFLIGWNLTHSEAEAVARLLTEYRNQVLQNN